MKRPFANSRASTALTRRTLKAFLIGVMLALWPVTSQAQLKIGTVDMQKVFEGFYKKKEADTMLQQKGADADKVIRSWEEDYKKVNEEYRRLIEGANDQAVSADEREKRKKSAEAKLVEIRDIQKSYDQFKREEGVRIDDMKRRWQDKILQEIRGVITNKAKVGNFTMVLDTGNRFDLPVVLYSNGQNDLTDEVLSELNANAPPGALTGSAKEEKTGLTLPSAADTEPKKPGSTLTNSTEVRTAPPTTKPGRNPKKP